MANLSKIEEQLIEKYIRPETNSRFETNLRKIRETMEDIWRPEVRIIHNFTNHGEGHSERIAEFVYKLLKNNYGDELSKEEMYLLLAGIYLHDIGMQCDVVRFPEIRKKAEELGANFNINFTSQIASDYSIEEQKAIRENHHYLSAAWIDCALKKNEYLFIWEDVPGNDNIRLTEFLSDDLKIGWVKNAKIKKSDDNKAITIKEENNVIKNVITFKLNEEEKKVNLEIKGEGRYEYILKKENDKIKIYKNDNILRSAAKDIPRELVTDLMDICKFHSKLQIYDCPDEFELDENGRKGMVAALLRLGDELDVDANRVSIETVKNFNLPPRNTVYWWLHHFTKVSFPKQKQNSIKVIVKLHTDDKEKYGGLINEIFIKKFIEKNREVLNVLNSNSTPIVINEKDSGVVGNEHFKQLPSDVIKELELIQKESYSLTKPPDVCTLPQAAQSGESRIFSRETPKKRSRITFRNLAFLKEFFSMGKHLPYLLYFIGKSGGENGITRTQFTKLCANYVQAWNHEVKGTSYSPYTINKKAHPYGMVACINIELLKRYELYLYEINNEFLNWKPEDIPNNWEDWKLGSVDHRDDVDVITIYPKNIERYLDHRENVKMDVLTKLSHDTLAKIYLEISGMKNGTEKLNILASHRTVENSLECMDYLAFSWENSYKILTNIIENNKIDEGNIEKIVKLIDVICMSCEQIETHTMHIYKDLKEVINELKILAERYMGTELIEVFILNLIDTLNKSVIEHYSKKHYFHRRYIENREFNYPTTKAIVDIVYESYPSIYPLDSYNAMEKCLNKPRLLPIAFIKKGEEALEEIKQIHDMKISSAIWQPIKYSKIKRINTIISEFENDEWETD
ncbi:hypothetical protein BEH94_07390 [Candidatus Altiarchaeales archaeon WOR_SM1_SCG]|nr:hypothetical protein BEH94_07390 [Candidatus Altiarchaeales archaeon WOR_SM1_SCG]